MIQLMLQYLTRSKYGFTSAIPDHITGVAREELMNLKSLVVTYEHVKVAFPEFSIDDCTRYARRVNKVLYDYGNRRLKYPDLLEVRWSSQSVSSMIYDNDPYSQLNVIEFTLYILRMRGFILSRTSQTDVGRVLILKEDD